MRLSRYLTVSALGAKTHNAHNASHSQAISGHDATVLLAPVQRMANRLFALDVLNVSGQSLAVSIARAAMLTRRQLGCRATTCSARQRVVAADDN